MSVRSVVSHRQTTEWQQASGQPISIESAERQRMIYKFPIMLRVREPVPHITKRRGAVVLIFDSKGACG